MSTGDVSIEAWLAYAEMVGPILIMMLVIGLCAGIFQTITQIREASIPFVLKMAGLAVLTSTAGPLVMRSTEHFATKLFSAIPGLLNG